MDFPYTYDQVVDAIASTRGDTAHFVLTNYLHSHASDVGPERFRRLLETASLRGQDEILIHIAIARLDPSYASKLPGMLRSTRNINTKQVLLAALPDLLNSMTSSAAMADELETWVRHRVKQRSHPGTNASWEIPGAILSVLYCTDTSRARSLLADLEPDLSQFDSDRGQATIESTDEDFKDKLVEWWQGIENPPTRERSLSEIADHLAKTSRAPAKVMRRLGFKPAN